MRCVCGYEYKEEYIKMGEYKVTIGDEDFIEVIGSFHTQEKAWEREERVSIWACPKCKTIRLSH